MTDKEIKEKCEQDFKTLGGKISKYHGKKKIKKEGYFQKFLRRVKVLING